MQLMTWPLARLGSRFGLLFEPQRRRVMHSALGRFFDRPLDLAVGLIEPDGTERVLPLTREGELLYGCEQLERINSITWRGYSETAGLRFELNIHSPFYPQNERMCIMPVFYLELRVVAAPRVRWRVKRYRPTGKVRLFLRLHRAETQVQVSDRQIDLAYDQVLQPEYEAFAESLGNAPIEQPRTARVRERIYSLNPDAKPMQSEQGGQGLTLELPVTEEASGIKWRLVWAAHTADPVLDLEGKTGTLRYVRHWPDLESVMEQAVATRDDNLAHSRRFEKLLEQAPLRRPQWHLLALGFQSFLSNTFWCDLGDGREWFSDWGGSRMLHSAVDVEYNVSLLYLSIWPRLLRLTLDAWAGRENEHGESGGSYLNHDLGWGLKLDGSGYPHNTPVMSNANFLLMLQAYTHWTGDLEPVGRHAGVVRRLAEYLLWADRDGSGFASSGALSGIDDGLPALQFSRKQTYLAIKRVAALHAAADLLGRVEDGEVAERCRQATAEAVPRIEAEAWLGDHYMVCVDRQAAGLTDVWTGQPLPLGPLVGSDGYSIYTANGLLLPAIIGQPVGFDMDRLTWDLVNATRETLTPYGCAHSSGDAMNVWVSQNIWRDLVGQYLEVPLPCLAGRYWDLETYSNTGDQSFGYIDSYIGNELSFSPRGAVTFGYFLAGPRLRIDRLDGLHVSVQPNLNAPQRWPLLPLADWKAGKIPVCVVDGYGKVWIEGGVEPVKIRGQVEEGTIG